MLDETSASRAIGSNETAVMINSDEHELDTDPGIQGSDNGASSSMQRQLSAAMQAVVEEPTFNLRLIDAVRQSHCLYDASDKQYRSADYKIKVWNRLVHFLGFQGDARTLYNRWKQLRDKYGKEKKKLKYSGEQHSQWQYFKHLEFLDPHMVDRTQQRFERNKEGKTEQRQIVITDPNFALHLINQVRTQPCLYDIKDTKYRHTEYRNQAWAEIAKNLAFPGDVSALYKQWKKIRDRYVREKRKLRMTNGTENEEPNWELYRELIWIDRYLDERAAQVKRKQESSDLSGEECMEDAYSTQNASGLSNSLPGNSTTPLDAAHHHQQQQHYANVLMPNSGQPIEEAAIVGHQLQQLVKLQPQQQIVGATLHNPTRSRVSDVGTTLLGAGPIGMCASSATVTNTALMMPIQPQQQLHHQQLQGGTQQVIIANGPAVIDGDRAFAMSVAADLQCLSDQARDMARVQIKHLLENSKITIVRA
ncbi:hypothetical protein niasHT_006733 [Heterodera trifolii]|uniref:MADF domain-containing protein n=1 Tax=Heterodera trifolii TaxID=157864 RepID=A0ABD2LWK8_9BILA